VLPVCVNDVAAIESLRISGKNLDLCVAIDEDVPQILIGDQPRLRQILLNLLNNAVKLELPYQLPAEVPAADIPADKDLP
jgi:signal transduction histidine kinase